MNARIILTSAAFLALGAAVATPSFALPSAVGVGPGGQAGASTGSGGGASTNGGSGGGSSHGGGSANPGSAGQGSSGQGPGHGGR